MEILRSVNRRGTKCDKWDDNPENILPMWIADMDFACATPILDALCTRIEHPIFGYTFMDETDSDALIGFYARRHGLSLTKDMLLFTTGVVKSLLLSVQTFTHPSDSVLVQTPIYPPFFDVVKTCGRTVVENPLIETDGYYTMDFDDLDAKLAHCKLFLFCSPHNPSGRVWEKETLEHVVALCKKHGTVLMCDEIHCDFAFDRVHTPLLALPDVQKGVVVALSASKTFNIAGLNHSALAVPDAQLRARLQAQMDYMGMEHGNFLGVIASTAAYSQCDPWLDLVLAQVLHNRKAALDMLCELHLPARPNEGSYLLWMDLRSFGRTCAQLANAFVSNGVRLSLGTEFGPQGEGFMRLNMATSDACFAQGLSRIRATLLSLR